MFFRRIAPALGAAFMLLGLAGCLMPKAPAPAAEPQPDLFELQIRIGRFPIIVERSKDAILLLADDKGWYEMPEPPIEAEGADPHVVANLVLREAVLGLNKVRMEACARAVLDGTVCEAVFLPAWMSRSAKEKPTLAELDAWSAETQGELLSVFVPLCEKAVPKSGDDLFCSIE